MKIAFPFCRPEKSGVGRDGIVGSIDDCGGGDGGDVIFLVNAFVWGVSPFDCFCYGNQSGDL